MFADKEWDSEPIEQIDTSTGDSDNNSDDSSQNDDDSSDTNTGDNENDDTPPREKIKIKLSDNKEREIKSKAVMKQLNRSRNRGTMKGKVRTPNVRYVHDRQRETDMTASHRGKTVINPEKKKKGKGHRKKKK